VQCAELKGKTINKGKRKEQSKRHSKRQSKVKNVQSKKQIKGRNSDNAWG
jgi:hypothetical protein